MATDFLYPTSMELREIEQDKLPRLVEQRPIFDFFPIREVDDAIVAWEQMDRFTGLQKVRGVNGAPTEVQRVGGRRFIEEPGTYGEYITIDERELVTRRPYGSLAGVINIDDLVMSAQDQLLERRLDRIESIGWNLVANGTFSVAGPLGAVLHTGSYTTQAFSAVTAWSTFSSSSPLADFRNVKVKARGYSVRFDATAKAYMSSLTANNMYSNGNSADLYGRRSQGFGTLNSLAQINALFLGDNLPQIVEYDEGYLDDTSTFQPYLPTGTVVVVGNRTSGTPVGEYIMTRDANNPNLEPGPYSRVIDRGETQIPRTIEVHDGHRGGPTLPFGSAIVVMHV